MRGNTELGTNDDDPPTVASSEGLDVVLLDIDKLAALLNVGERFVRRLVEQRRIPFLEIGKYVRFHPVDVEEWIVRQRVHTVDTSHRRRG